MYLLGSFTSDMYLLGSLSQKRTHICLRQVWVLFNEINPLRICEMLSEREIWLRHVKYAAGVGGCISFHFPHKRKISQ